MNHFTIGIGHIYISCFRNFVLAIVIHRMKISFLLNKNQHFQSIIIKKCDNEKEIMRKH